MRAHSLTLISVSECSTFASRNDSSEVPKLVFLTHCPAARLALTRKSDNESGRGEEEEMENKREGGR